MKSVNVVARVPSDIKIEAESILSSLGVPVSVLINMLYRQVISTRSVPFPITMADAVSQKELVASLLKGLDDAKEGRLSNAKEFIQELRTEINESTTSA